ncbi:hypothetical protein AGMMS50268_05340 [Spirochaetia bacterium]|nr:hypothetical protein AGMMS50268_05340 [Spirochaetia bacterium]
MKNKRFAIGAVVLLALFALIFAGCPNNSSPATTVLEGTWTGSGKSFNFSASTLVATLGTNVMTGSLSEVSTTSFKFTPTGLTAGGVPAPLDTVFNGQAVPTYTFTITVSGSSLTIDGITSSHPAYNTWDMIYLQLLPHINTTLTK